MRQAIINTFKNFKWNSKRMVLFSIIYKMLALFVIIPLNYLLLNYYMQQAGIGQMTNTEMLKFLLTIPGIIGILCIVAISFIAIFIEMAVLIYMAKKSHEQQPVSLVEGAINGIRIIPKKISRYHIRMVLMAAIIGPLTGLGLSSAMIKELVVPSFIKFAVCKTWQGTAVFTLLMLGLCILLVRWLLALPIFIIEEGTLKEAFKKSIRLYKTIKYKLITAVVVWGLMMVALQGIAFIAYVAVGTVGITVLTPWPMIGEGFINLYSTLFVIGKTVFGLVMLPLFISFLVEIYYMYGYQGASQRMFKPVANYEKYKWYQVAKQYDKTVSQAIITLFAILVGAIALGTLSISMTPQDIAITAHRGSSIKAPENSLSAIEGAIGEQADYAEIDVMLTKDGKVVLFHDSNLKRLAGDPRTIKEMTLEEVQKVDIGTSFSPEYAGEGIPTLEEALMVAKNRIKLNIEMKPTGDSWELAVEVGRLIEAHGMEQQVVVSSLNYEAVEAFKKCLPVTRAGYILSLGFGDFTNIDVDFIAVEYGLLTKGLTQAMNKMGREVHVWTINDPVRVRDVARLGVDNIITDSVEMVQATLDTVAYDKVDSPYHRFYYITYLLQRYFKI
ncbi:MAG: glycerophosphoryl diester phosphodiesterase membrane domain-containing protein [Cellulosilyticaceae bacterium]